MATAESPPNGIKLKHLLGNTKITLMLVGAAGAGKSSLINSLIKLVQLSDVSPDMKLNSYIPTATKELMGGHTMMREPVVLTDTLTILDNRGWHDWTQEVATRELIAQIRGERFLEDDVNWEDGDEEPLSFAISPKVDCISIVINGVGGVESMVGLRGLIETCRKQIGRRPSVVITHKDEASKEQIESIQATLKSYAIERLNIFVVQNVTPDDDLEDNSTLSLCQFVDRCYIDGKVGAIHSKGKEERNLEKHRILQQQEDENRSKEIKDLKYKRQATEEGEAIVRLKIKTETEKHRSESEDKIMKGKEKHAEVTNDVEETYVEKSNKTRTERYEQYLEDLFTQRLNIDKNKK